MKEKKGKIESFNNARLGNCRELLYKPARREISGGGPHRPINAHSLAELKRAMKRPSRGGIKERLEREAVELVKETTSKRPASESRYIQP